MSGYSLKKFHSAGPLSQPSCLLTLGSRSWLKCGRLLRPLGSIKQAMVTSVQRKSENPRGICGETSIDDSREIFDASHIGGDR